MQFLEGLECENYFEEIDSKNRKENENLWKLTFVATIINNKLKIKEYICIKKGKYELNIKQICVSLDRDYSMNKRRIIITKKNGNFYDKVYKKSFYYGFNKGICIIYLKYSIGCIYDKSYYHFNKGECIMRREYICSISNRRHYNNSETYVNIKQYRKNLDIRLIYKFRSNYYKRCMDSHELSHFKMDDFFL